MTPDRNRPEGGYGRAVRPTAAKRLTDLDERIRQRLNTRERAKPDGGTEEPVPRTTGVDPRLVFVITSFDDRLERAFEAIKAAAEGNDLRAERLKDAQGDFRISEMIDRKIRAARLIVADLTLESQNVYYELGVARGKDKTVVTIAREGTRVHFNAQDWNTIFYDDSRTLEEELSIRFRYELTTGAIERGL
jgi:hypothetical protein